MRLTPPKKIVWWISLVLVVIGIIGCFLPDVPVIGDYEFVFAAASAALMLLATAITGL